MPLPTARSAPWTAPPPRPRFSDAVAVTVAFPVHGRGPPPRSADALAVDANGRGLRPGLLYSNSGLRGRFEVAGISRAAR